ncbi:leucine-rich repeat domain-containing protein [Bythopirellula goksoeyrii]|uniref:Leucine Rich repeats (2 copies) n=1 Tax=Bythopirellula goksoeyrii TaxID=1400387 RepID=A0A5B9QHS1_9BACT|nr:hypothetical protein [Bythopirellula goksoeyrii]QEG37130.1 Leucine Rich repeats (2 copies) [Bythopirellula goksoeyrii]
MLNSSVDRVKWHPRIRFSLRALLLLVTFSSVWLAVQVHQAKRQVALVNTIQELGGEIRYDYQPHVMEDAWLTYQAETSWLPPPKYEPSGPVWLRRLIGNEYFQTVVGIRFKKRGEISESAIEQIASQANLEELYLMRTGISDSDLQVIGQLKKLELLVIRDNQVTDEGLAYLHSLESLKQLNVINTSVTAVGVAKLKQYLPDCIVHLEEPTLAEDSKELSKKFQLKNSRSLKLPQLPGF